MCLLAPVPGLPPTDMSVDTGANFITNWYIGWQQRVAVRTIIYSHLINERSTKTCRFSYDTPLLLLYVSSPNTENDGDQVKVFQKKTQRSICFNLYQ